MYANMKVTFRDGSSMFSWRVARHEGDPADVVRVSEDLNDGNDKYAVEGRTRKVSLADIDRIEADF